MRISINQAIKYEVRSSWWAGFCTGDKLSTLAGKYFEWKVRRKYNRYLNNLPFAERLMTPFDELTATTD